MRQKKSPINIEIMKLEKQEITFRTKKLEKKESKINAFLEEKVPKKLQSTLDTAFAKAFKLIFEKGTGIIEKTYNKDEREKAFKINEYAANLRQNKKSLQAFSKKAGGAGVVNTLVSGTAGIGMGVLGIGIPDIVVLTGMILKAIYQIALDYGYDYETEEERKFILLVIQGAVAKGEPFIEHDSKVNEWIKEQGRKELASTDELIKDAALGLSNDLLYMKFLQSIPIVGVVGGAYDAVCMKQIVDYATLKYKRRFLLSRKKGSE